MKQQILVNTSSFEEAVSRIEKLENNILVKSNRECIEDLTDIMGYAFLKSEMILLHGRLNAIAKKLGISGYWNPVLSKE